MENARIILHYTVIQANLVGAPRGKVLATPSSSSVTTGTALQTPPVSPASAATSVTNSSSTGNSSKGMGS